MNGPCLTATVPLPCVMPRWNIYCASSLRQQGIPVDPTMSGSKGNGHSSLRAEPIWVPRNADQHQALLQRLPDSFPHLPSNNRTVVQQEAHLHPSRGRSLPIDSTRDFASRSQCSLTKLKSCALPVQAFQSCAKPEVIKAMAEAAHLVQAGIPRLCVTA